MRRTRALVLRFLLPLGLLACAAPLAARAEICLPPTLGERPRLHRTGDIRLFWLEPLLRQHDICWRAPRLPDERRIFVYGNSSIFGFPHPPERSAVGIVNRRFELRGVPAHLYNLGFAFTYQLKEAVIIAESLRFGPDMIVYGVTLDDMVHVAPIFFPALAEFFDENSVAVERLADSPPPTLAEPLQRYKQGQAERVRPRAAWSSLRQAGTFVRLRAEDTARAIRQYWFPDLREERPKIQKARSYDCARVSREFAKNYADWQDWSLLEHLAELRTSRGIDVLVVNLPVAHEPVGDCYNFRYPAAAFHEYTRWLEQKTRDLQLPFLDLHALLKPGDFVDSLHPTARGQNKLASVLDANLEKFLDAAPAQ